jgi:hypothetical protein
VKVLVLKLNFVKKHVIKIKILVSKWFMNPKCGHAKNEIAYIQFFTTIVLQ